nr:immunoglobulin light chain junction region [Macaca mulatta]MOW73013.1 immunoglobulin light chain junction region [Macaca mulatta]MOW73353.1 immunoglobulin light chain junction region [Macaca mulatta]MOW73469.1 immunoglobulin light chain junction region [Macaca mulatta]MOW74522.1 immunoglobulin light chain junction region [Macaca mulatta]
CGQGTHWPFTF